MTIPDKTVEENESNIIIGLKSGDEESYFSLFNTYFVALSAFAFKYLKDSETSKEIVQDLFVHLYEIRKSFLITTSIKSYLYQSVRNRCLNYIKQNRTHKKHLENLKLAEVSMESLQDEIHLIELEQKVSNIISDLPDHWWQGTGSCPFFAPP